jgi:hypothetical protein
MPVVIDDVLAGSIVGDDPAYFSSFIRLLRGDPCDPVPVSTCDVMIEEVITTPNTSTGAFKPNGTATIVINNAIVDYEFSIDGVYWQASNVFTGLGGFNKQNPMAVPTYTARARKRTDLNCFATQTFSIHTSTAALFATVSVLRNPRTVGGSDGEVSVMVISGSGNYTVKFSHDNITHDLSSGAAFQSMVKTGLPAGSYTVTVTDLANGAVKTFTVALTNPVLSEPEPGDFFEVPAMNSLHFVIEDLDKPQTPDNRLLINQYYPRFKKTNYFQLVEKSDFIVTQFNSNYKHSHAVLLTYPDRTFVKNFQAAVLVEKNIGETEDFPIRIENHTQAGQSRVYFNGPPPVAIETDVTFEILNNNEGFNGVYKPVSLAIDPNLGYEYIVINKAWALAAGIEFVSATGRFDVSTTDFNVYEIIHTFDDVAEGCYCIQLAAYDRPSNIVIAESEPIDLQVTHKNALALRYRNIDNAWNLSFSHGYTGLIRIPALLGHKRSPGGERTTSRDSNYSLVKVSARRQRTFVLETFMLPMYLHEKIAVALDCDYWSINNVEYQTEEAYGEPSYINRYLLANSSVRIEQTNWHGRYNSDDINVLVDDGFIVGNGGFIRK